MQCQTYTCKTNLGIWFFSTINDNILDVRVKLDECVLSFEDAMDYANEDTRVKMFYQYSELYETVSRKLYDQTYFEVA